MIPRLCAISPGDGRDLAPWLDALDGLPALLLREPALALGALQPLVDRARAQGITVWVHTKTPGHEAVTGHHGHHVADGAAPLASPLPFGASAHDAVGLRRAQQLGASWAFVSPVFSPTSKVDDRPTLGIEGLADLQEAAPGLPLYALGGITPAAWALLPDGVGAAVLGDLFGQQTPRAAGERLRAHLDAMGR